MLKKIVKEVLLRPVLITHAEKGKGKVALTFDDGPNEKYTKQVLDVLDRYNAKATFFLVGTNMVKNPELVERMIARGHQICNHSWSHRILRGISSREMVKEVTMFDEASKQWLQTPSIYLRPPKGEMSIKLLLYIFLRRKKIVLWNKDPEDYKAESTEEITSYFKINTISDGDIVLLHDKTKYISESLSEILSEICARGLKPVVLSDAV